MTQHLQQTMPANLRQYIGKDPAYVPRSAEVAINQALQKNMPAHLRQYADAYRDQRIFNPGPNADSNNFQTRPVSPHPPTPDPLRRSHSMPVGSQHTVELDTLPVAAESLFSSDHPTQVAPGAGPIGPQVISPSPDGQAPPTPQSTDPYDFMNTPEAPKKMSLNLPGFNSAGPTVKRLITILVGLLLLVIVVSVFKSILAGGTNLNQLTVVVQDQQELLHISTAASQVQNLFPNDQNLVATAQISLSSASSQTLSYLTLNKVKLKTATLDGRISKSIDLQLTNAQTAGNYDQVLDQVIQSQLNRYQSDLHYAYVATKGPHGRALLSSEYNQAGLLLSEAKANEASNS